MREEGVQRREHFLAILTTEYTIYYYFVLFSLFLSFLFWWVTCLKPPPPPVTPYLGLREDIRPLGFSQCKMRDALNSLPLLALHFERSFNAKLVLSTEIRPKVLLHLNISSQPNILNFSVNYGKFRVALMTTEIRPKLREIERSIKGLSFSCIKLMGGSTIFGSSTKKF